MVYKADESGEYRPERYMLCSTGVNGRTPKGTFKMGAYRVRFSKFARDGRYGQYWTQIRKAIYFHTTLYTAKDVNAYEAASFNKAGRGGFPRLRAAYGAGCKVDVVSYRPRHGLRDTGGGPR